jgi:hypothetical protein
MNREDDVIDLGIASAQTMGPGGQPIDDFLGEVAAGLADD